MSFISLLFLLNFGTFLNNIYLINKLNKIKFFLNKNLIKNFSKLPESSAILESLYLSK